VLLIFDIEFYCSRYIDIRYFFHLGFDKARTAAKLYHDTF